MVPVLPAKYATPVQSPLKAIVTGQGPNDFRLDLTDLPTLVTPPTVAIRENR